MRRRVGSAKAEKSLSGAGDGGLGMQELYSGMRMQTSPLPEMPVNTRPSRVHLSLRVRPEKLEELVRFYSRLFDAPPRKHHDDYVQFDLSEPPLNLTFTPTARAATGELDHLGIQVFSSEALDAARERLRAAGLELREEPRVECCYSRQDKFWLTDPEGREVEIFLKLHDIEQHGRSDATAQAGAPATACCATGTCASA
jgi:extradiol dioxygenase family protein